MSVMSQFILAYDVAVERNIFEPVPNLETNNIVQYDQLHFTRLLRLTESPTHRLTDSHKQPHLSAAWLLIWAETFSRGAFQSICPAAALSREGDKEAGWEFCPATGALINVRADAGVDLLRSGVCE